MLHTHTHLIYIELALPSGELPVAGAELSDKVMTTERREADTDDRETERKEHKN